MRWESPTAAARSLLPVDDNTFKDVYFRVAHRWYGLSLWTACSARRRRSAAARAPARSNGRQRHDDDSEAGPPGLDFWRAWNLDTGIYGWYGKSNVPLTPATGVAYDPNNHSTFADDHFQRIGIDGRLTWFDMGYLWDRLSGDTIHFPASIKTTSPSARRSTGAT